MVLSEVLSEMLRGLGEVFSLCRIGTNKREVGLEIGKRVNFGHAREIVGRTSQSLEIKICCPDI